jgi:pimeloyl-ACP methyl ester carboxylesterase
MDLGQVTLDDGRRVDVCTAGDPDGAPVLLQHGMPQSRLVAAHADEHARECGVRLLTISRPGFGNSSPAAPSLADRGDDAVEVAARLGAERFAVLGISFGAPFAAATAVRGGDHVSALGIAGGMGPWLLIDTDPDDPELAEDRRILGQFEQDGDLEAALAEYRQMGHQWLDEVISHEDDEELMDAFDEMTAPPEGREPDELAWMTPELRARFAQDVREALTTYGGLALDNVTAGRSWDIDVGTIRQPTFLWYGDADDLYPTHSDWWKDQVPHAELTVHAGEDHGKAYLTRWPEMLERLGATLS